VLNDETAKILVEQALVQAAAGANRRALPT
jgi:delta-aminolevulinic acid dehydratase/porphobilinogen synthase